MRTVNLKTMFSCLAGCIFIFIPSLSYSADFLLQPPPKSLDKLYSERGKTSKWVEQMRQINKNFQEVFIYLDAEKREKALESAKAFGASYQKASEMVPEWKDLFDLETAKLFNASVAKNNTEKTAQLATKLEKTCTQCHQKHNISVWTRYHWPSTQTIKLFDPVNEKELSYNQYMHQLANSLESIKIYFNQENYTASWKAIDIFSKRFKGLRSACSKCHVTEWTKNSTTVKDFFVGEDIVDALQEIKKSLASGVPDAKLFQKKMGYIAKQSCKTCHLVHQPSAIIQRAWGHIP
ncbi:MAG: hypothetical protein HOL15_09765 [Nitrospinaceae bacterium]|jgi:nitrate/TMAO reductase-like tetraheme cytochrome c subunit|nr:hypothetical protein [Nitrospina sp.]MBT5377087.1 hypothetical protein [Nitrospinaceae bacterium]